MTEAPAQLPAIDAEGLAPLVREAIGRDVAEILRWRHEPYGHSLDEVYGTARSVFRYSGTARAGGADVPWTMVLKIVAAGRTADAASPANGDREPLAYRSGLLAGISGIRAPRCYAVVDRPAGGFWLWLEDVADDGGREWPRERFLAAARHLGEFNAASLGIVPHAAAYPWLSRPPLADAVRDTAPRVARVADERRDPRVAEAISPGAAASLLALLDKIDGWLARLDDLPQTICHWDAHRANLISRRRHDGAIETVAIDWAGMGWGPVGAETSKLLSQAVNFYGLGEHALPSLDKALFASYVEGLRACGWNGDERAARFGHAAASAARLVVRTATALELASNPRARAAFERASGQPFTDLAVKFSATLPYYLSLADEADRLAAGV